MRGAVEKMLQPLRDLASWLGTKIKTVLTGFRTAVSDAFGAVGRVISGLWDNTVKPVFGWIVEKWLSVAGAILTGAATAFGWVPGIGGKLKKAAAKFNTFKDDVNRELNGIKDRTVVVTAKGEVMARLPSGKFKGKMIPMARGGQVPMVPGARRGKDSVPAILMPGEYVVRADGSNLHEALSHYGAPGYAKGGFIEARKRNLHGNLKPRFEAAVDKRIGPAAAKFLNSAQGHPGSQSGLIALGRWLQSLGARVSEHPAFGGVHPVHTKGSAHYSGRAIDVNYGPGGQNATEMAFFDRIAGAIRAKGFKVLWRVPGHFNHLHAAYDRGGLATGTGLMPKATIKPERVLSPRQTAAFEDYMRGDTRTATAEASPLIGGDLVIQSSGNVRDDIGEAMFQVRRIRRGGSPHAR